MELLILLPIGVFNSAIARLPCLQAHNLDHHLRAQENGPESDGLVFAQLYKLVREQITGGSAPTPEVGIFCLTVNTVQVCDKHMWLRILVWH